MKHFILLSTFFLLVACTPSHKNDTSSFSLPPELADCKVFKLSNDIGSIIYVTRCPNSSTHTVTTGKSPHHFTVIEQ